MRHFTRVQCAATRGPAAAKERAMNAPAERSRERARGGRGARRREPRSAQRAGRDGESRARARGATRRQAAPAINADYGRASRTSGIISSNRRRKYRAAAMNAGWFG